MSEFIQVLSRPGYAVSKEGEVLGPRGILHPRVDRLGYHNVDLCGRCTLVHQLVAEVFVDNPRGLVEVNHKDRNKGNNSWDNLEWCTHQENMEHALGQTFFLLSPDGVEVQIFNLAKFCRENNLHGSNMCQVLKGTRKSCKGWKIP